MAAADYRFDTQDGLRLFSRVYAGPNAAAHVVLCLHGLMRNSRDFEDLATHLAARYRVIVPDVRGRGLSARDPNFNNYRIPMYVNDLLLLCAGLGLERIRGYAGKSAPVRSWEEAVAQVRSIYGPVWPGLSDERWQRIARLSYRENAQGVPEADADPLIAEPLRDPKTAAPSLWPLWGVLAKVPILAIRGAQSDLLNAATLARMQREKPDLEVLEVANRGHPPLLDEPECLAAIDEFLPAASTA